jgi:cell division protein FtsI/penicillin-binding protein 2
MLVGIFMLALCALLARLFDIQILQHHLLSGLAERQHQKSAELHGKRGTIYDRRLRELALSIDRESIYLNPGEFSASPGGDPTGPLLRAQGRDDSERGKATANLSGSNARSS